MITETTAISCAAFGALSTSLGIAAGIGWMRENRLLRIARDAAAYWQASDNKRSEHVLWYEEQFHVLASRWENEERARKAADDRAADLEDRLQTIERQRSDNTRRGNLTKAAKRKALVDATTAAVARDNAADRAEPVLDIAA